MNRIGDNVSKVKDIIAFMTSVFFSFFGLLAVPILLLVSANIIDYITGLMASSNRNEKLSSYRSLKGIFKKVSMYLLIIVGFMVDTLINFTVTNLNFNFSFPTFVSCIITVWLICNEVISILENLIDIGIELPQFLLPLVKRIKSKTEGKNKSENKN